MFMKKSIFYRWLNLRLEMNLQEVWRSSLGILVWLYWSLLQEAETADDDSVELQIEEKDYK